MDEKFDIAKKVAIVTGGNVGIGLSIARTLIDAGASVVTCSRRDYPSPPAAEGLEGVGDRIVHMTCDVREPDQVEAVVQRAKESFGSVDVLVNNAGGAPWTNSSTASPRFFASVIAINLTGLMVFSQRANAVMQEQEDGGVIVNIASVAGLVPSPFSAAYGAAKAGVINVTRSFAQEWGPKVRVNCVAPGLILTEGADFLAPTDEIKESIAKQIPVKRIGLPEDIADVVHYLCTPAARYVNGETIVADGGGQLRAGG